MDDRCFAKSIPNRLRPEEIIQITQFVRVEARNIFQKGMDGRPIVQYFQVHGSDVQPKIKKPKLSDLRKREWLEKNGFDFLNNLSILLRRIAGLDPFGIDPESLP